MNALFTPYIQQDLDKERGEICHVLDPHLHKPIVYMIQDYYEYTTWKKLTMCMDQLGGDPRDLIQLLMIGDIENSVLGFLKEKFENWPASRTSKLLLMRIGYVLE